MRERVKCGKREKRDEKEKGREWEGRRDPSQLKFLATPLPSTVYIVRVTFDTVQSTWRCSVGLDAEPAEEEHISERQSVRYNFRVKPVVHIEIESS